MLSLMQRFAISGLATALQLGWFGTNDRSALAANGDAGHSCLGHGRRTEGLDISAHEKHGYDLH